MKENREILAVNPALKFSNLGNFCFVCIVFVCSPIFSQPAKKTEKHYSEGCIL